MYYLSDEDLKRSCLEALENSRRNSTSGQLSPHDAGSIVRLHCLYLFQVGKLEQVKNVYVDFDRFLYQPKLKFTLEFA